MNGTADEMVAEAIASGFPVEAWDRMARESMSPIDDYLDKVTNMAAFWLDRVADGNPEVLAAPFAEYKAKVLIGLKQHDNGNDDLPGDEAFTLAFFMGLEIGASIAASGTFVDPRPGITEAIETARGMLESNREDARAGRGRHRRIADGVA